MKAIQITKENITALGEWRTSGALISSSVGGYCLSQYLGHRGYYVNEILPGFELISWQRFQTEVMGIKLNYEIY